MSKLCLNMIVKNEMANLQRCLSAVAPYISCWVIGDTGSTDGTQEFIEKFFADRGIPGEIHSFPFENFAQARNQALERARASKLEFDYIIFTDADMEFVADDPNFAKTLKHSAYMLLQRAGVSYWNLRLLRRSTPASYRGVTHEFLDVRVGTTKNLATASYIDHGTGANRFEKYDRDARLLTNAIAEEKDPGMIARYTFYLANTLRDSNQKEAALDAYTRRVEQGHWQQEVYISLLNIAKIKGELFYPQNEVIAACEQATMVCSSRAEALHAAAHFCREKKLFDEGYNFAIRGLKIDYPRDALFVEDWIYDYGLLDELAINAYWCGRYAEAAEACEELLRANKIPTEMRARVESNRQHSIERLAEFGVPKALQYIANRDRLLGDRSPSDRNWMKLWASARHLKESGDGEKFRLAALSAYKKRPRRAEPLYDLARDLREKGRYDESVVFCEQGLAVYNFTEEPDIENFFCLIGLHEELSIAANYSKDLEQKKRGFAACDRLSLARGVPAPQRSLARSNLRFYVEDANALLPTLNLRRLPLQAPVGLRSISASVARQGQDIYILQQYQNDAAETDPSSENSQSKFGEGPSIVCINTDFEFISEQKVIIKSFSFGDSTVDPRSIRDFRLFSFKEELWCSAAYQHAAEVDGLIHVIGRIDDHRQQTCRLVDLSAVNSGAVSPRGTSYMPFLSVSDEDKAAVEITFISSIDPITEIDRHGHILALQDAPIDVQQFRGASQLIAFGTGYLALICEVFRSTEDDDLISCHRFVWFDAARKLSAVSRPFYLHKHSVESANGIAWHPDDKRILISFTAEDGINWIADVDATEIHEILNSVSSFYSSLSRKLDEKVENSVSIGSKRLAPPISFYSLAPYLRAANLPQDRRHLSNPYDSLVMHHLDSKASQGLPQIHCFYEVLDEKSDHRTLRAATYSMRAAGHPVRVWSYSPSKLEFLSHSGVELRDAAEVIPRQFFDRVLAKSEIRYFSDIFRYAVLYEFGGAWMDGDIVLVRPFAYRGDYFFNLQWRDAGRGHYVCGNVMYARVFSPHMRELYERAVKIFTESAITEFGDIGPKLLSDYILSPTGSELRSWIFSPVFFNSIDWTETNLFEQTLGSLSDYLNDERVVGVHLWNARTHSTTERPSGSLISILSNPTERLPSLSNVFDRFAIDRNRLTGNRHHYSRVYEAILGDQRFSLSQIVEIGTSPDGQACDAWRTYFPFCEVNAFNSEAFSNTIPAPHVALSDGSHERGLSQEFGLLNHPRLDAVIDNGSHASLDQQAALAALFPALAPGGWYFIESLDWQPARESGSSVSTTKSLIADIKAHGRPTTASDPLGISSLIPYFDQILFFDSLYELGRANLIGGLVAIRKTLN
ncbi:hypothetical protein FMGBMHLM_4475 [Methylobacterium aerolatum]|nr:hypothetical protein FMGBMHLM_4475 [Methylobacterium aerolatum]